MKKTNLNWQSVIISTLLATIISSGLTYSITKQEIKNSRQFKVVDIKKLSSASIENVRKMIESSTTKLNPEAIELIAQNEAKKMFEFIAISSRGKDIIIPKSSALFTPDGYEITEEIAEKLGLKGVTNSSFSDRINKKN